MGGEGGKLCSCAVMQLPVVSVVEPCSFAARLPKSEGSVLAGRFCSYESSPKSVFLDKFL